MRILSYKPSHDGAVAFIEDGNLRFSFEAEKDSGQRFSSLNLHHFAHALGHLDQAPHVIATSGWEDNQGGYWGVARREVTGPFCGTSILHFTSSHERSHLLAAYGLSPFDQGSPCYALVWEGLIGRFYYIDSKLNIRAFPNLLYGPGYRFAYTYFFASATPTSTFTGSLDLAGKLAAICGFADKSRMSRDQRAFVDYILNLDVMQKENSGMNTVIDKASMAHSRFYECGVETQCFKNVAQRISDRIFRIFYDFAKNNLRRQYPLLISGGCGLNCAWNTRWRNVGLFSDVFVPPVPNDSGSAIGTAVDAQHYLTGNAKVAWSVYCGPPFLFDCEIPYWIEAGPLDLASLANELFSGQIVPWVQGNCEMGPRSLGNRSLLAAPFEDRMRARINAIKGREQFRPIAPVTLEEEFDAHFRGVPSRYMLHLPKVRNQRLRAVTHVDDSARVQVLGRDDNVALRALLLEFKKLSGVAVLCNTSLNFPGRGFINRLSDIFRFLEAHELGLAVVGQVTYRRK